MKQLLIIAVVGALALIGTLGGCAPSQSVQSGGEEEQAIPAHFTTYTDESGLFSISYPLDWETALPIIEDRDEVIDKVVLSIESGDPLEQSYLIFYAGLVGDEEHLYKPIVGITVESLPDVSWTHDKMVEAQIKKIKESSQDYHEFYRFNTTVEGRVATVLDCEATWPELGEQHYVLMFTIKGRTAWIVCCTSLPEEFSEWQEDFDDIVRSLRILK